MLGRHEIPSGYYCGPTALMLLTGIEWPLLRSELNRIRRRETTQAITGTYTDELIQCLKAFQIKIVDKIFNEVPLVLNHYRNDLSGYWLIESPKHYMAVVDNRVADNHSVKWTPIDRAKQRLRKVRQAWRLEDV